MFKTKKEVQAYVPSALTVESSALCERVQGEHMFGKVKCKTYAAATTTTSGRSISRGRRRCGIRTTGTLANCDVG